MAEAAFQKIARRNSIAGNGIFRCRDRRPKSTGETAIVLQRPATLKTGGKIPAEKGLFSIVHGLGGSGRLDGGRDRDRTCDPLDVNEVLSR
jgi:hypothetical protein